MKSIKSAGDLAINGAPPAFPEMLHVGRPWVGPREAFDKYVDGIYERNWLTNDGPLVQELERRVAEHHCVEHCVAMTNGTIALEIAIRALELGGEVIVPSYTFIATAHALHWQEITPVFADIDPATHLLDPAAVRRMLTPRTSAIIGVHLWGRAAPVDELQAIADEHGLHLMFDAAHAFGCSYKGQMIGSFGACEVLSFHATKYFNSFEGGAVLTNDVVLADKMRLMRNFGFSGMDNVIHPGTNGKMSEICAAMGLVNLDYLEERKRVNRLTYESYRSALQRIPGLSVLEYNDAESNNYQYVVVELDARFPSSRDACLEALHAENIRARRYFWPGCHRMQPYRSLFPHAGLLLPETEDIAARVLVMPAGGMVDETVVETVAAVFRVLAENPA
ncbi:aminotransferase class I/II-fold pyridoxal phosphate-dependent enzyme [Mangrovimicrobium sediminis]|uniref:Aminotransferase class I/II-fold pyridoxal phosphate-dependent enzyme n=1 Tax=Mangrovimicrobium sediminis TaxID=2562682 RepID=A0A4Z0M818_9GAMM|nr:aminotransferase class I/II-fold pyridoxal phosphate-dependent enzyme [Haliea sp. SAOS-164]TGD75659.1 aminotransferase class I/II-fold pyridoxal phosphate-dependent enzyme [Haliea sp. SAOS-164]